MEIKSNVDITYATTMKTRAVAASYAEAVSEQDILGAIAHSKQHKLPLLLLGGGSNTVITTAMLNMFVVKNRYSTMNVIGKTKEYSDVEISSGYVIGRLVRECGEMGLEGFEYHMGLPGTLGGAIYMNSKWTRPVQYMGDRLIHARIADLDGNVRTVERDYFDFAYDYSKLQDTGEILLSATYRLSHNDPEFLKSRSREALEHRNKTQPTHRATSGCFFQNITPQQMETAGIDKLSAGYLIDQAGFKGVRRGSFVVSHVHANFILDEAEGDPADLRELIIDIKHAVKERFGIELVEEVRLVA